MTESYTLYERQEFESDSDSEDFEDETLSVSKQNYVGDFEKFNMKREELYIMLKNTEHLSLKDAPKDIDLKQYIKKLNKDEQLSVMFSKSIYRKLFDFDCRLPVCYIDSRFLNLEHIDSGRWDGDIRSLNYKFSFSRSLMTCVINSKYWNGCVEYFRFPVIGSKRFCSKVIRAPKWNGSIKYFPLSVFESEDFCVKVFNSEKWDGNCDVFRGTRVPDYIIAILFNSEKWDKNCRSIISFLP